MSLSLDRADVERLYRDHAHLVLRRARLILGNEADAQETLQDVFAVLIRSPGDVRSPGAVVAWLYRATTHHCLNVIRRRRTGARLAAVAPVEPSSTNGRGQALAEVRSLLATLPAEEGAAVVHHHLDGMTYEEVAGQLGCSRRKVAYLLERAHGLLLERERWEKTA